MKSVYHDIKFALVAEKINADTETVSTSVIDTAGYEGCVFLIGVAKGEIAAVTAKVKQDTALAFNVDPQDLLGSNVAIPTAVLTPASGIIDIYQPQERFLRCDVAVPNVNTAVAVQVWAGLYGAHTAPATQVATASEFHASPGEGTA
jgi:hypothetical protein